MKIQSGPPEQKPHNVTPHSPARASFADMIAAPDRARAETADHAAGFQALGMFGVSGATPCRSTKAPPGAGPEPSSARTPAIAGVIPDRFSPPDEAQSPAGVSIEGTLTAKAPSDLRTQAITVHERSPRVESLLDGAASERLDSPAGDLVPHSKSRRSTMRSQGAGASRTGVSVVNSGAENASVAVILPDVSADEAERFRISAETVLREFGLVLDKVTINGDGRPQVEPRGRGSQSWR